MTYSDLTLISDVFMIAGALSVTLYCFVLSRRLRALTDLEKGVGGAVAVMAVQVEDLKLALTKAQETAKNSVIDLSEANSRADAAAHKLELLISSLHDLPAQKPTKNMQSPFFVRPNDVREKAT